MKCLMSENIEQIFTKFTTSLLCSKLNIWVSCCICLYHYIFRSETTVSLVYLWHDTLWYTCTIIALHTFARWWYTHTKCTRQTVVSDWNIYSDISVVTLSNEWVCGHLLAGIAGLNPARGMDVCVWWVLSGRGLCKCLITCPEQSYWVCVIGCNQVQH